jgi:exodeoxyribonuclease-3
MKIMLYNLDHGGKEGDNLCARWPALIATIKNVNPDIGVLLECWSWEAEKEFKKFAAKLGYPYYYLSVSNTKHHLGLISRIKPKKIKMHKKNFHHSVLQAQFAAPFDFTIFGIHLSPKAEDIRLQEAKRLIKLAQNASPAIITGDFNSLSPADCYNEKKLITQFKKQNIIKFGNGKLEKRVIGTMLRSGLVDIYKSHHRGQKLHYSVPSRCNKDQEHATKMRLDYAFVSKTLAPRITASRIVKNQYSDRSSDHYPLLLNLK